MFNFLWSKPSRNRLPNDREDYSLIFIIIVMNWIEITNENQLAELSFLSKNKPQVIFKHSTRCSISSMAKSRLERGASPENIDFYYLDLIKHRNISQKVAEDFDVSHESPQILMIKDGKCIYDESHSGITMNEIIEQANAH